MVADPPAVPAPSEIGIHLYWIPLGAGGVGFVRFNGLVYEAIKARAQRRKPLDLYHAALQVLTPDGLFAIENAWPSPDANTISRGVVFEGPVFSPRLARFRPFRYELRCWRDGVIPDIGEAVESPQHVSSDPPRADRLLDLVESVPALTWGRDEMGVGDMWNSNSVISWLLARSGVAIGALRPPSGGRAPGWEAGIIAGRRDLQA